MRTFEHLTKLLRRCSTATVCVIRLVCWLSLWPWPSLGQHPLMSSWRRFCLDLIGEDLLTETDIKRIEDQSLNALKNRPQLRPGVTSGLTQLAASQQRVVVLTEGNYKTVLRNIEDHGLTNFFEDISFTESKDARFFEQILQSSGAPRVAFMVGDQLDRDISPAKEAGLDNNLFSRWVPTEMGARVGNCRSRFQHQRLFRGANHC